MRLWTATPDETLTADDEMLIIADKSPSAYRTISEVASILHLPQHVLRFWESKFPQIKPLKRGGGRRFYKPDDVDLLRGIRHLLYSEGYTIKGVQKLIKSNGVKSIQEIARASVAMPLALAPVENLSPHEVSEPVASAATPVSVAALFSASHPMASEAYADEVAFDTLKSLANSVGEGEQPAVQMRHIPIQFTHPDDPEFSDDAIEDEILTHNFLEALAHSDDPVMQLESLYPTLARANLSADMVRQLQATLFELMECRRLLDQARLVYA